VDRQAAMQALYVLCPQRWRLKFNLTKTPWNYDGMH
jgi:hypothetical protein